MTDRAPRPRLRPQVERIPLQRSGPEGPEALTVLRDPFELCDPLAIDRGFDALLDLLDGTRTLAQIRQSLLMRGTLDLDPVALADFVDELGVSGLLDDDRFRARWVDALEHFLAAPHRPPWAADRLYPADPSALHDELTLALPGPGARLSPESEVIGVLCPHQPFPALARIYDLTLRDLPSPEAVSLVVVLATDHHPGMLPFALTDKDYATPLGPVRTDAALVERLDARLGWARREEIRHRVGAPIELAAVMLRWIYGDACPPILPVLCGRSVLGERQAEATAEFLGALELALEGRRVLYWAAAELAHAGPAYGGPALDDAFVAGIEAHDRACLDPLLHGRPERLRRRCLEPVPQGRPSGGAALDTLARLLPLGYRATLGAYAAAPTPGDAEGRIGAAGVRFLAPMAAPGRRAGLAGPLP